MKIARGSHRTVGRPRRRFNRLSRIRIERQRGEHECESNKASSISFHRANGVICDLHFESAAHRIKESPHPLVVAKSWIKACQNSWLMTRILGEDLAGITSTTVSAMFRPGAGARVTRQSSRHGVLTLPKLGRRLVAHGG